MASAWLASTAAVVVTNDGIPGADDGVVPAAAAAAAVGAGITLVLRVDIDASFCASCVE